MAQGDSSGCESLSDAEAQICYTNQAIGSNDVGICNQAPIPDGCALNLAHELEDPQPILDFKESGIDRDILLGAYSTMTLDPSAWSLIEDNRIHDGSVIMLPGAAYGRLNKAPVDDYCDNLRGGYEYDPMSGQLPDEEILSNKNLCEMTVAAMNELVSGGDDCTTRLSSLQQEYIGQDHSKDCKDLVSKAREMEKRIAEAENLAEIMEILEEINQRTYEDECDFSGVWNTNWGEMKLQHSGASVTGTYTWDKGKISGSTIGNTFVGWWSEAPSYSPPDDAGSVELTFADDCSTFSGNWGYGNGDRTGTWSGATKVSDIPIPKIDLPPPEELNDDLLEPSVESVTSSGNSDFPEPELIDEPDSSELDTIEDIDEIIPPIQKGGKVLDLSGNVEIKREGSEEWVPIQNGDFINPGDDIRTGSDGRVRVKVEGRGYDESSIFTAGDNTDFRMGDFFKPDEPEKGYIDLLRGALRVIVEGWAGGGRVQVIKTGTTIASEVIIDYEPENDIGNYYVIEGHMNVTNMETGEMKSLTDNQKLVVENGNLGEIQTLSQAEWDTLVEEKGLDLGEDKSTETPTLIAESASESRGLGLNSIIIVVIIILVVAILAFKKMRK
jgi:hypothetical protein